MPNVESVRIVRVAKFSRVVPDLDTIDTFVFHPFCWRGQLGGNPELVEVDGAIKCSACRGRLDRED